jgi:hypothetical protein
MLNFQLKQLQDKLKELESKNPQSDLEKEEIERIRKSFQNLSNQYLGFDEEEETDSSN